MPLYEYQCPECGRFEIIQKFSDAPLSACPRCGEEVHKLLSAPAIQFKGSGWYVTDYARKGAGGDGAGAAKEGSAKEGAAKEAPSKDSAAASKGSSSGTSADSTTKTKPASGSGSTS